MNWLRVFFVGGLTSYRALFGWLNPWIFVPILLVYPLFQILFFVYLGRGADVESDSFFLVGNALQTAAVPALFAMAQVMVNERSFQTLPTLLVSPASRLALFLGRSVPALVNAFVVSVFAFTAGSIVLHVHPRTAAISSIVLAIAACSLSCTGFGLCLGSIGLRGRNVFVLANLVDGFLLVLCGVNVPLDELPQWAQSLSQALPLTHGVEAARDAIGGSSLSDVSGLITTEALIGVAYFTLGMLLLRLFEHEGRRTASLETM
jgi:ABC-2 type transport system permease protein